jgi:hypothetical protein
MSGFGAAGVLVRRRRFGGWDLRRQIGDGVPDPQIGSPALLVARVIDAFKIRFGLHLCPSTGQDSGRQRAPVLSP